MYWANAYIADDANCLLLFVTISPLRLHLDAQKFPQSLVDLTQPLPPRGPIPLLFQQSFALLTIRSLSEHDWAQQKLFLGNLFWVLQHSSPQTFDVMDLFTMIERLFDIVAETQI